MKVRTRIDCWTQKSELGSQMLIPKGTQGSRVAISGGVATVLFDCMPSQVKVLVEQIETADHVETKHE